MRGTLKNVCSHRPFLAFLLLPGHLLIAHVPVVLDSVFLLLVGEGAVCMALRVADLRDIGIRHLYMCMRTPVPFFLWPFYVAAAVNYIEYDDQYDSSDYEEYSFRSLIHVLENN